MNRAPRLVEVFKGKEGAAFKATSEVLIEQMESALKEGKIKVEDFSLRDIAQATLGAEGVLALGSTSDPRGSLLKLKEEVDPVNLSVFNQITGLVVLQGVVTGYEAPEFIGNQLVTQESSSEDNTREAGLEALDAEALVVPEGEEYPDAKFGQDWINVPGSEKRGRKIGITREMIFFDRTASALKIARGVGERVGFSKEVRTLSVVLGVTNTFQRKGIARNTYVLTGGGDPRVNALASNPLVDWTDVDAVNALFTGMVDDKAVGEPIMVVPDTILVSGFKRMTAAQILSATEVRELTNAAARSTNGSNPLNTLPMNLLSSPLFDWILVNKGGVSASNARNYWYMGQPKKAFKYRTLFPLNVRSAAPNSEAEFNRDIVAQFRADERGVAYVEAPWMMAKSYDVV